MGKTDLGRDMVGTISFRHNPAEMPKAPCAFARVEIGYFLPKSFEKVLNSWVKSESLRRPMNTIRWDSFIPVGLCFDS